MKEYLQCIGGPCHGMWTRAYGHIEPGGLVHVLPSEFDQVAYYFPPSSPAEGRKLDTTPHGEEYRLLHTDIDGCSYGWCLVWTGIPEKEEG